MESLKISSPEDNYLSKYDNSRFKVLCEKLKGKYVQNRNILFITGPQFKIETFEKDVAENRNSAGHANDVVLDVDRVNKDFEFVDKLLKVIERGMING